MTTLNDLASRTDIKFSKPRFEIDQASNWAHIAWDIKVRIDRRPVYTGTYRSGLACLDKIRARLAERGLGRLRDDLARIVSTRGGGWDIKWSAHPELQQACVELAIMSGRSRSAVEARPTTKDVLASLILNIETGMRLAQVIAASDLPAIREEASEL